MLFSSLIFLFYFLPIVLLLYYLFSFSRRIQNSILLVFSLFFYAFGEIRYVGIMIMSIVMNYFFGLLVDKFKENKKYAKRILIISCIYNLLILFVFKYLNFTVRNINDLFSTKFYVPRIAIPIGISFFTFQALSYVIDVYRNEAKAEKNIFNVGLYIAFFPQLVAGPIVRYVTIAEAIKNRKESFNKFGVGTCRFVTGLAKKVLISNVMAQIADKIFGLNVTSNLPITLAWLGSIAYTFQIFFDFSGYSDMAIGLGLMFGFKFEENFNYPYISKSITEFWRRWHISLSRWFRDYVYFPMGGSRVPNKDRMIVNLLVVWLLTGIWHGAEWTFVVWGLVNFVFISIEKLFDFEKIRIPNVLKHIYALLIINFSWVIFRAASLKDAGKYLSSMVGVGNYGEVFSSYTVMFIRENIVFFIAAIILSMPIGRKCNKLLLDRAGGYKIIETIYPAAILGVFILCVCHLVKGSYNPFIYFNF